MNAGIHEPTHLKLAEKYYVERFEELRTLISAEEQQFKAITVEIEQIRAGQRDEEIKARITGIPVPEKEAEALPVAGESEAIPQEPTVSTDAAPPLPPDEVPEVEMTVAEPGAEPETQQEADVAANEPAPPSPEAAAMEDVETKAQTAESTPPPDVASSPPENLDHLMQASDEETQEKVPQDVQAPEPVHEEQSVDKAPDTAPEETAAPPEEGTAAPEEETVAPEEETAPMEVIEPTAAVVKPEPADTPKDEEAMDQSQSKPVSRNSDTASIPESGQAEETISTRRSTRRRPSISVPAPPATHAAPKKRGRRPQQKSTPDPEPEPEAEQSATPAPSVKEATTPAMEETQPDEEIPLSAAIRRRESKRKASVLGGLDSPRDRKRAREDSEPVDDDEQGSGSGSAVLRRRATGGRTEEQVALKRFQTVITMVHNQISQHRNGNIFHNPIKTSEAPDYHDIVKRPIDLKTIKAKIKDGVIGNSLEYQRDIYLMFANAMMYNRPGSDVHVMAEDMMVESDSYINTFRQTEGYVRGSRI
ncbi:hypothetical protein DFH07DRAFT_229553 [Mycena maculata]|uniref:Bromo domain-containing protein n=1 Tax=Mycena maculata TaxID=230809 RepID=A0AAD7JVS5_9AGAR|nr:hypothetical protein DFH07DRAFT_229553 [Mycena maculata]